MYSFIHLPNHWLIDSLIHSSSYLYVPLLMNEFIQIFIHPSQNQTLKHDHVVCCLNISQYHNSTKDLIRIHIWSLFIYFFKDSFSSSVLVSRLSRITAWTFSCGSAGTTRGCVCRQTSSQTRWRWTPKCSSACGSLICSSPTRRTPTSTTWHRRTSCCSSSATGTCSLAWGNCRLTASDSRPSSDIYSLLPFPFIGSSLQPPHEFGWVLRKCRV